LARLQERLQTLSGVLFSEVRALLFLALKALTFLRALPLVQPVRAQGNLLKARGRLSVKRWAQALPEILHLARLAGLFLLCPRPFLQATPRI
jgi:hypothetical protein